MEETLANSKLSKLAKEKGFDWKVIYYIGIRTNGEIDPDLCSMTPLTNFNVTRNLISVPSLSLLQKWLREEHFTDTTPIYTFSDAVTNAMYYDSSVISELVQVEDYEEVNYDSKLTYDEALEKAIEEALLLLPTIKYFYL